MKKEVSNLCHIYKIGQVVYNEKHEVGVVDYQGYEGIKKFYYVNGFKKPWISEDKIDVKCEQ